MVVNADLMVKNVISIKHGIKISLSVKWNEWIFEWLCKNAIDNRIITCEDETLNNTTTIKTISYKFFIKI